MDDMYCNNAFFNEVTFSSFPKSNKCMQSFRKRVNCVLEISRFLTTNVARAVLILVLQFSLSFFERHKNQFLSGKMWPLINYLWKQLSYGRHSQIMYLCRPLSVLRGLPISLQPQCITKSAGCLLFCFSISLIVFWLLTETKSYP